MTRDTKKPPLKLEKNIIPNSEQFFAEITEAVPALIGVYSLVTGQYLYVNDAIEKLLGYKKAAFLEGGLSFVTSIVHPEDIQPIMEKNKEMLKIANEQKMGEREKLVAEFEYRMKHMNGSWVWLKTYGSVFKRTIDGKVEQVLNVSVDITRRKTAEDAANKSRLDRQVSSLIENMSDDFITIDKYGNYLYVNEKTATSLKIDKKEFNGKNIWKLFPQLKKSSLYKKVQDVIRTNKAIQHEYRGVLTEGWFSASIYPTDEGVSIYFTDITHRKEAEISLKKSEERYKAFVEQSTEGVWRFELEIPVSTKLAPSKQIELIYKYAYLAECNEVFARMYGYQSCEDVTGAKLSDFMPKSEKANREYLTEFITSGYRMTNAESHEVDKDGNKKYFQNNLVGIVEEGVVLRAWGTQRDITELMKAEESLRTSEERLALALEASQMGIWDFDIEKNVIQWSEQLEKIFGIEPGSFNGTFEQYTSFLHPEDRESLKKVIAHALKTGKQYQVEHRIIWPDRSVHWIMGMGKAYFDPKTKKPIRMTGSSQNIDERKRMEQRKDDFIGMASHELKTPVTSLKIFTQILRRQFQGEGKTTSVKYLEKMDDQINKLTRLIRELLDVSKISAGKLQITTTHFDVIELTNEIIEYFQETAKQKIVVKSPRSLLILADRDRIGQVIINLLTNALKYGPSKSEVIIKIEQSKDDTRISVQDFGVGIPKEHRERVFERFYQIAPPTESAASGLGMGLYIASQIVALHAGKLWVESPSSAEAPAGGEEGKAITAGRQGSTFIFSIPNVKKK